MNELIRAKVRTLALATLAAGFAVTAAGCSYATGGGNNHVLRDNHVSVVMEQSSNVVAAPA